MATSIPFPITLPPGTVLGRLPLPQSGDAEAIPFASLHLAISNPITNSLSGDVLLTNTGTYFDGPSIAQGTSGTWFVSGTVLVFDGGGGTMNVKLWDGATVIASARVVAFSGAQGSPVSLSGFITSPAGNLRISVEDTSTVNGKILFNQSGNSKDSTITAIQLA